MDHRGRLTEEVDQYIAGLPEEIQELAISLGNIVFESAPELIEEFKWSMPNYSYHGLVCYLQASKKHVNLGFHKGNELEEFDTGNFLQGTGKTMRHIRIKKMEDIQPAVLKSFIQQAVALNEG